MGRGLTEAIRILEADDSWRARRILILKYEKKLEPSEIELKKSAEKVRNDLIMIQSWLEEKSAPKMVFQNLYSGVIVTMIEAYTMYMEEFYPSIQIEAPIKKLYKGSLRWFKYQSKDAATRRFRDDVANIWDKLGL